MEEKENIEKACDENPPRVHRRYCMDAGAQNGPWKFKNVREEMDTICRGEVVCYAEDRTKRQDSGQEKTEENEGASAEAVSWINRGPRKRGLLKKGGGGRKFNVKLSRLKEQKEEKGPPGLRGTHKLPEGETGHVQRTGNEKGSGLLSGNTRSWTSVEQDLTSSEESFPT